jgi:hypothetical protein
MGADPNDPIVDWSSLSRVMENFHDRSGVLRLRYHNVEGCRLVSPGDLHDLVDRSVGAWVRGKEGELYFTLSSKKSSGRSRARANIGNKSLPTPTAA